MMDMITRGVKTPALAYVIHPVQPQNTARKIKITHAVMKFFLLILFGLEIVMAKIENYDYFCHDYDRH